MAWLNRFGIPYPELGLAGGVLIALALVPVYRSTLSQTWLYESINALVLGFGLMSWGLILGVIAEQLKNR